jgi:hypothetical protein
VNPYYISSDRQSFRCVSLIALEKIPFIHPGPIIPQPALGQRRVIHFTLFLSIHKRVFLVIIRKIYAVVKIERPFLRAGFSLLIPFPAEEIIVPYGNGGIDFGGF